MKIKRLLVVFVMLIVTTSIVSITPARADSPYDGQKSCGADVNTSNGDGTANTGAPLCPPPDWEALVKQNYLSSAGTVNFLTPYVSRIIDDERLEQSQQNTMTWDMFSVSSESYAVGSEITFGPGDTQDECGFILNMADQSNYDMLGFNRIGKVTLYRQVAGQWLTNNPSIQLGQGRLQFTSSNKIAVIERRGRYFDVIVNGQGIGVSFEDDSRPLQYNHFGAILNPNWAGIAMQSFNNETRNTVCIFHHSWYWQIVEAGRPGDTSMVSDQPGYDRSGSDLYNPPYTANSFQDCEALCLADNACKAISYDTSNGSCWMKSTVPPSRRGPRFHTAVKVIQ